MLSSLRYRTTWPESIDRIEAREVLAPAVERAYAAMLPAEPEHITRAVSQIASALQVSIPDGEGMVIYVHMLQSLPRLALRNGCTELLRTYAYPRLPYPAEILAACATAQAELKFWVLSVRRAWTLLEATS